jgi:hypothetical protein
MFLREKESAREAYNPPPGMRVYSFDSRGFVFSMKLTVGVVALFSVVHYGIAFGAPLLLESNNTEQGEDRSIEVELPPVEESLVLEKMQEYEESLATRSIGTASVDTLIEAHSRLIAADLSEMKLYLFEDGHATITVPILSKGKRGSRWETPTGLYKIQTKEENHFSSLGAVYMPKSMQFFGNFFIHGWPYYPDGTPVPEGYSGGCIRLSTEDATRVYDFASRETPLFIWEDREACKGVNLSSDSGIDEKCTEGAETKANNLIAIIINLLSIIIGIIAVVVLIISGLRMITSGGDSNGVASARNGIIYAIVGLIIVAFAQFIVKFVLSKV